MEVIYDDNQVVVALKPANIPTQADNSGDEDMLSKVKAFVKEKFNKSGEAFIGLVHRLDRPTAGVMVFARNSKSASRLTAQIQNGEFQKTYYAVVKGSPKKPKDRLINYLKKDEANNKVSLCSLSEIGAKKAVLDYEVLAKHEGLSLLKINLETGRSHQIRVQLSGIGCPVFGDAKYGIDVAPNSKTTNLALWAGELEFKHPTEDKVLVFKVNPPEKSPWNLFKHIY